MRVLLINPLPCSFKWELPYPPLGLAYLASVLRRYDHMVRIIDMYIPEFARLKVVEREISTFRPDLIGVSAMTFGFNKTLDVIRKAKQTKPKTPIVVGGPHASIMRDKLSRDIPEVDFVVYGEGEFTLLELCNAIDSASGFGDIQGLVWRTDNKVITNPPRPWNNNLDGLPFAAESFDLFRFNKYYDPLQAAIVTSRGCPYGCIFCAVSETCGKKFRPRSPENVADEIEYLYLRFRTKHFHFLDDNFSLDMTRAKRVCDELLKRKLDITWDTPNGIRADRIDLELLRKMKKSGCQEVWYGLESASQAIVDGLNKHLKVSAVRKAIKWSKECGLKVGVFFVVGSPGENFHTVRQSVNLALTMNVESFFSMLTPYPGTKLWDWVSTHARWTQDPYEYLYSHGHVEEAGVPYETDDFLKKERIRAWKFVKRTITRKKIEREYEATLKRIFPNSHKKVLEGATIFLSTLRGIPYLNIILRSEVTSVLKRLIVLKGDA